MKRKRINDYSCSERHYSYRNQSHDAIRCAVEPNKVEICQAMVTEPSPDRSSLHRTAPSHSTVSLRFNRFVLKATAASASGNASQTVGAITRAWLARCFRLVCAVMIVKMDMKDVCRLCLTDDDLVWIFDKRFENSDNMKDVIYITTGVEVRPSCYSLCTLSQHGSRFVQSNKYIYRLIAVLFCYLRFIIIDIFKYKFRLSEILTT